MEPADFNVDRVSEWRFVYQTNFRSSRQPKSQQFRTVTTRTGGIFFIARRTIPRYDGDLSRLHFTECHGAFFTLKMSEACTLLSHERQLPEIRKRKGWTCGRSGRRVCHPERPALPSPSFSHHGTDEFVKPSRILERRPFGKLSLPEEQIGIISQLVCGRIR